MSVERPMSMERPMSVAPAIRPSSYPPAVLFAVWPLLVALVACGCADDATKPVNHLPPECGAVIVVTTDFASGGLSAVSADSTGSVTEDLASIHADAVARTHDGLIYVVNRFGADNVQVVDPARGYVTVRQIPVGAGSNPHDIAIIAPDRAFVSRNGSDGLLEIDPGTGAARDTISLRRFADGDSVPDMDRLFYREPYLYIAIARIDFGGGTYRPVVPSYLAILDTRTNTLVDTEEMVPGIQAIRLQGLNPSAPMVWDAASSVLLVPEAGAYGTLDAGVEKIDLTTMRSIGWLTREEDLGGDLIDFTLGPGGRGYATIADLGAITSLVAFDLETGEKIGALHTSNGYDLADLAVTSCGILLVCDRAYTAPGLRIYDAMTGRAISSVEQPVPTGLPPFELVPLD